MKTFNLDLLSYDWKEFTIYKFLKFLKNKHGMNIEIVGMELPDGVFGAWLKRRKNHYIFFRNDVSPVHKCHIILHELGHLLNGHDTYEIKDDDLENIANGDFSFLDFARKREQNESSEEIEAETTAIEIQERVICYQEYIVIGVPKNNEHKDFLHSLGII